MRPSPKIVYFVRHGQSEGNISKFQQGASGGLTEAGAQQVKSVADRLKGRNYDMAFVSEMERATETGEILSNELGINFIKTPLLNERIVPTEMTKIERRSEKWNKILEEVENHATSEDWHFSDEENYFEQRERAYKLLELLQNTEAQTILCVTHGIYLRVVMAAMTNAPDTKIEDIQAAKFTLNTNNTGVTICQYFANNTDHIGKFRDNGWRIHVWNDHDHLPESLLNGFLEN